MISDTIPPSAAAANNKVTPPPEVGPDEANGMVIDILCNGTNRGLDRSIDAMSTLFTLSATKRVAWLTGNLSKKQ